MSELKPIGPVLADVVAAVEEDRPKYVYILVDADGEECGDRIYAMSEARCAEIEAVIPRLVTKRAVGFERYALHLTGTGKIVR